MLCVLLSLFDAQQARAQYTYVPTSAQTGTWDDPTVWTGGTVGTFPNAIDASATLTLPLSTAPTGNYNVQVSKTAGTIITVGSLTINDSETGNTNTRIGANGVGTLTFQASSGPATITENSSSPTDAFGQAHIFAPVTFASNTVITQNHNAALDNAGLDFGSSNNSAGGVTAASNITLTKDGLGNVQFAVAPAGPGTGFQGSVVVNAGAVRESANVFANAAAVTVNNGGQFQLGSGTVATWNLASGAVLTLNGLGKDPSTIDFDGALRFQNGAGTSNFNNPVTLASDSSVFVNATLTPVPPAPVTFGSLALTQLVSGVGGLSKDGPGILALTQGNSYGTDGTGTTVNGGTLLVENTTGSATGAGPVQVLASATLGGTGTIAGSVGLTGATLYPGLTGTPGTLTLGATTLDAASTLTYQLGAPGTVGGGVNALTDVNGSLTLGGSLNVSPLTGFGVGTYTLFDYTGSLTNNGLAISGLPAGLIGVIDTSAAGVVNLKVSAVPEPSSVVLLLMGGALAATVAVRRRRAAA